MLERKRNFSTALDKTDHENDLEKKTTKKWRVLFPIEKKHSTDFRKRAHSLTCKWWLIALNPFSNQCSLKSYHALETNERKQRNAFYGHYERGSGWSYVNVNLVRSVLESLVPNFTLGPSWSIHCCLRPWFTLFHLLYHLCGLL